MSKKIYNNVELLSTPTEDNHIAKLKNIKIDAIKVNGVEQIPVNKVINVITPNAQFKTYSELTHETEKENSEINVSEGMITFIKEGEIVETTTEDGTVVKTEYPPGLYKWNSKNNKWEHQDYLLREEFANHAEDSAKHVSSANRFSWDNKADGKFETTDIDITSSTFKGQSKYLVDSAYLYSQLKNMKSALDDGYETISDFKEHESNKHTNVLHLTSAEKSKLHTHSNQSTILDKLGKDDNGNLTFNGTSVAQGSAIATKTSLGQVIVGDGIEVDSKGTIYIDWYKSTDNGDGTSSVTIGGVEYTKDNDTGEIKGSVINDVEIGSTTTTDSDGNTIKVDTVGSSTVTTTTAPDGSSTIISDNGGVITTTKKDTNGNTISTVIGDTVVSGSVTDTTPTETTTDKDGNTIETTVTTTTTPDGQNQTTTTVVTTQTGEKTETTTTVSSSGSNVDVGIATGEKTTVEKDASGNVTNTTTEPVLNKDGEDNLIKQEDLDYLFGTLEYLW